MSSTGSLLAHLECRACGIEVPADRLATVCPTCSGPLFASYRLNHWNGRGWREAISGRAATLWRYRELLPVQSVKAITTLGEGLTPILALGAVPEAKEIEVWLKDDGTMPTGSFKARGMSVAVSRARELGVRRMYVPSAGNAGVALAAYAARAGLPARVYLPQGTPAAMERACLGYGAEVVKGGSTIGEAGASARRIESGGGAFDLSTLREPYRAEGKKTMGFEIWEQMAPDGMPDAIVYPTGGGTGLVGMYRAFVQLQALGLLEQLPRLYSVQPENCAPIVRALRDGKSQATPWEGAKSAAPGLLVPAPFGSERILEAIRESRGGGATVADHAILEAVGHLARRHGISASPEGAAPYAALEILLRERAVRPGERVLLYNTGSGIPFLSAS
ncbi:MAG: threonine synthase [Thermoplasmata archaeon]|nr:threonine synthase [Thermoplasmata archaeon]